MSKPIGFLAERRLMWQSFRKDFFHTGSVIPSDTPTRSTSASAIASSANRAAQGGRRAKTWELVVL